MADPLGLSHRLQIPYDPAQAIYQRPNQATLRFERPDGRFIKDGSDGHFYQRRSNQIARWPFLAMQRKPEVKSEPDRARQSQSARALRID